MLQHKSDNISAGEEDCDEVCELDDSYPQSGLVDNQGQSEAQMDFEKRGNS